VIPDAFVKLPYELVATPGERGVMPYPVASLPCACGVTLDEHAVTLDEHGVMPD
jgi:hypothetical protein